MECAAWLAGHEGLEKELMLVELVVGFLNPNDVKHCPVFPARKREIPFMAVNPESLDILKLPRNLRNNRACRNKL